MDPLMAELIGAVILLATNLATFFKSHTDVNDIKADRESTKIDRDRTFHDIIERMVKVEFQCLTNKDNTALLFTKYDDLAAQLRLLTTELAKATTELANTNSVLKELKTRG